MNNGELIDALSKLPRGVFACAYGSDGNLHDIKDVKFVNGSVRILAEPMPKKPVKVLNASSILNDPGVPNPTFRELYKLDKWDLFFDGKLVNYKTSFCQDNGTKPEFEKWLTDEDPSKEFRFGFFLAKWK